MSGPRTAPVTQAEAEAVLALVAEWMGVECFMGDPFCPEGRAVEAHLSVRHVDNGTECADHRFRPVPTGDEAARRGEGPVLDMSWEPMYGGPRPTVLLEGGPFDWPTACGPWLRSRLAASHPHLFIEPVTSYALGIYLA